MKTAKQLERDIDDKDLADFVRGAFKYNVLKRARLAYVVEGILRDRGLETSGLDNEGLAALARTELARGSGHATVRHATMITEDQARLMPRYEFIAHWLAAVTKKKENRDLAHGKRVRRKGRNWQVVSANGSVEYETPDADRLFDYARRGPLGWWIRKAEEFRVDAYQRSTP